VKRPERLGPEQPLSVGVDPDASGGEYLWLPGSYPAAAFPTRIGRAGWYQGAVTARGRLAGGALPTLGLVLGNDEEPATNVTLVGEVWHRAFFGAPVRLEPGETLLIPMFMNDFAAPGGASDRDLHLDRIELAFLGAGDAAPFPSPAQTRGSRPTFTEPFHGLCLTGGTWVSGVFIGPASRIALQVNGAPVASQYSAAPRFRVDPSSS
jgi:hypothetical protein